MNEVNTCRLFERFNYLYRGRHLPDTQNLMCYGFSCGDGWFALIWQLSEQVEAYCQTHPDAADLMVVQVKQKLGELRFYTQPKIWDVEYLIEAARIRCLRHTGTCSLQSCELTGTPGSLCYSQVGQDPGYYQTLCPEKALELGFRSITTVRVEWQLPFRPSAK